MDKDPFVLGDYLHVYNRGNRKIKIVYDKHDKWRFLKSLRFLNDTRPIEDLFFHIRETGDSESGRTLSSSKNKAFDFSLPVSWSDPDPLVKIICFFLAPNHFHLLIKEIKEEGVSRFMRKLGTSYTKYLNIKRGESGSLFQGSYKRKVIHEMDYLQYLSVYIQVFNAFELYPDGFKEAIKNFDKAYQFAEDYNFSSLPDFLSKRSLGVIDKDIFGPMFERSKKYKSFSRICLVKKDLREILKPYTFK